MTLESGTTIGHYKVLSRIGVGGMGEVFLAEDTRLGRKVALKLLPIGVTKHDDRLARFEQEARAASALNHPNIITIYDIGEAEGAHFIATEFIEGETLRDRLEQRKLKLGEALDIGIQTASALAAAHQAGIVHRDIKPENIMLRPDGIAKVLDFGIAKLTEKFAEQETASPETAKSKSGSLVHTEPGVVVGSPNYMSPEQARGLKVDARTDIFSLGVVLYEMIAGLRPFDGETVTDVIVSVLERQPPPISHYDSQVPDKLVQLVASAMAKKREDRCQTIQEMLTVLQKQKRRLEYEEGLDLSISPDTVSQTTPPATGSRAVKGTAKDTALISSEIKQPRDTVITNFSPDELARLGKASRFNKGMIALVLSLIIGAAAITYFIWNSRGQVIDSLAVLPLNNISNDPNFEYLSDGITDSLINNLSQSLNLKVMSRNSVFRYKGQAVNAQAVARELGVRAVLVGSIMQRADNVSINIELIDAQDNSQVWGASYNRKLSDILAMQEEIAKRISEKLHLRLTGTEEERMTRRDTENTEAYHLYMKGRYNWNKRTEEGYKKGIEFFNQAIEKDPAYALAYAGLADCYSLLIEYGALPIEEARPLAKAAAMKAIEIDDTLAEAHTSLAAVNEYDWNWAEAEKQYRLAITMNPNYATGHHWYAIYLGAMGRHDEGLKEIRIAQELDPLSPIIGTGAGRLLYNARQYDQAIVQLRKIIELESSFAEAHFQLGLTYEAKQLYEEAINEFQKAATLFNDPAMIGWTGRVYALAGKKSQAQNIIERLKEMQKQRYVSPYMIAIIYAALGERDSALEWLEKMYEERSYYVSWLKADPVFDALRSDSRYQNLLKRAGLSP